MAALDYSTLVALYGVPPLTAPYFYRVRVYPGGHSFAELRKAHLIGSTSVTFELIGTPSEPPRDAGTVAAGLIEAYKRAADKLGWHAPANFAATIAGDFRPSAVTA